MTRSALSATAVLLPPASVSFYVANAQLRADAAKLTSDWRFARVNIDVQQGDVDHAIAMAQQGDTPDLLIVETALIDDSFIQRLELLSSHCSANTSAVVVGPVNDVYLYRRLINMGVSDYLSLPLEADVLLDVLARTLIEKQGVSDSRLIAFLGAKGGVGTSTFAEAMAEIVSARLDQKTVLLDAAGGWSYLSVAMGSEPITTFHETVRANLSTDQDALKRMLTPVNERLSILSTGVDPLLEDPVAPEHFEQILNRLMLTHPIAIVDLSGANAAIKKLVISKAHEIVLVATPTLPALRAARSLMHEIKDMRGGSGAEVELVLNMAGQTNLEVAKSDIEAALERKASLIVPYDAKLFHGAHMQGKKLIDTKGSESLMAQLLTLAGRVVRVNEDAVVSKKQEKGFLGELMGVLKSK